MSRDDHEHHENHLSLQGTQFSQRSNSDMSESESHSPYGHGGDVLYDENDGLRYVASRHEENKENEMIEKMDTLISQKKQCTMDEWEAMLQLQCPLPPRSYEFLDENNKKKSIKKTTARIFKHKLWVRDPDTHTVYEAVCEKADIDKHTKRLNKMRAVDQYLKHFRLTSSVEIFERFQNAVKKGDNVQITPKKKKKKKCCGMAKSDEHKDIQRKLVPKFQDRASFCITILRAILNAYFISLAFTEAYDLSQPCDANDDTCTETSVFIIYGILITGIAEAYLFLVAFLRTTYNTWSLLKRVCKRDTVHFQTKNMPEQIREMASTSILRFLPSGYQTNQVRKKWRELLDQLLGDYEFAVENAKTCKFLVRVRETCNIGFKVIGPILAVLALIFKVSIVDDFIGTIFNDGPSSVGYWPYFLEIFGYFGFVNQVAGIRKVRDIEMDSLQHFVFSGNDIKLSKSEKEMINIWWNYTIVSCVSNICLKFKYPVFDSIVFWYNLNPRKLQLLLKNHPFEGDEFLPTKKRIEKKEKHKKRRSKNNLIDDSKDSKEQESPDQVSGASPQQLSMTNEKISIKVDSLGVQTSAITPYGLGGSPSGLGGTPSSMTRQTSDDHDALIQQKAKEIQTQRNTMRSVTSVSAADQRDDEESDHDNNGNNQETEPLTSLRANASEMEQHASSSQGSKKEVVANDSDENAT